MKLIKTFEQFIFEKLPKNQWVTLKKDAKRYSDELITLVQSAYNKTDKGSFINSKKDVNRSKWISIDFDENPDIDATIFYRNSRGDETWKGNKIQGIGHDNTRESIDYVLHKLEDILNQDGYWVEASGALEKILYRMKVPYIKDPKLIDKIFPNKNVEFLNQDGKYIRSLESGEKVTETIFGFPKLK